MGQKSKMTSYKDLCENFDKYEQPPDNKSHISCARTQPGRERMTTSYSHEDFLHEIGDDDLEAARRAGKNTAIPMITRELIMA